MTVTSEQKARKYRYLVVVPTRQRADQQVNLILENRPAEEALKQLAPYLGRPVVLAGVDGPVPFVSLSVVNGAPGQCLEEIAGQIHTRISDGQDGFHLGPAL